MKNFTHYSHVTTTSSPLFTEKNRVCGDEWHDYALTDGESECFIHVSGAKFKAYGDMWIAKSDSMPESQSRAKEILGLPSSNPATYLHIFKFIIPNSYLGLQQPVILLASKEKNTSVWQGKIQDQLVPFIKLIESIPLK